MADDPLATVDDLRVRLENGLSEAAEPRAEAILTDVSAAVRLYTGQQFTAGTTTAQFLRPKNGIVRLPQRPVTAVGAVLDLHDNPVLYTWNGDDRIQVGANVPDTFAWEPWVGGIRGVKVTYDHGYETIPDALIGIVCWIAGRVLGNGPESSGDTQETIGSYSHSRGSVAGAGPFGLLADERAALDKWGSPEVGEIQVALR